jgi:hypothetical protein
MPQNESYPEFPPSFLPSGIKRKNKTERDCAGLLAVLKDGAGGIPTADRNSIRKAEASNRTR